MSFWLQKHSYEITKKNETKRNETKRNETKRNKTKQNKTKQNKTKQKQKKNKKQKLTGIKLRFGYHVGPISLYSLKPQDFDKPHRQCVFGVKNLVLKKYPKISTGVKPGILSQCGPKIFAIFKNPKILASKSRPWVFGLSQENGSYEKPQDFDTC